MARQCYAGETKPKTGKQRAWEGPVAHHEHVQARIKAGEATVKRGGVHSDHGGASNGDGGVPVAVVDKTSNQQDIKHHGITEKLKQCFPRSEAHRRVLATTALARRGLCRPRGRRAWSVSSRQNQPTIVGWVDAQEKDGTGTVFTKTTTALGRRCGLAGAMAVASGKQSKRTGPTATAWAK